MTRIAVIADIHGNLPALEAVLADIRRRGADITIDLGDCVCGPLWPRETEECLATLQFPTVRGNHDRELAETPRALMGPSDAYAFDAMTATARERLGRLPQSLLIADDVLAFHATPTSDATYLLETVVDGRMVLASPSEIAERIGAARAPLMLCGHTHQPRIIRARDGGLIVNPGSVGLPATVGDDHVGECGSPHARYAILTRGVDGAWTPELIALDYDWHAASARAAANGRPDWARGIATGFVR